ncbi:MAG: CHAT domain-containing protein, partial [bacterium]|nr:CHAT domain-containing protein [bacterium]
DKGLVTVETLAVGEEKLRHKVDYFRRAIDRGTDPRSQFFKPVQDAGRELYEVLIGPVASSIDSSDRVLILPDGPLHMLPFSALIRNSGEYLAEWKPVHFVLSATLYGQLRRTRPRPGDSPSMVAAFGDPVYPEIVRRENPDLIADVRVRAAVRRGLFDWEPLPHTRREVEGIAALYPAQSVQSYLGAEATEERAKGLPRTTDIVHFAGHGHLDDRFPLNSAVVLTIPEGFPEDRDNGLLQAWEIFERVRIDADLVVLSACESALGEERGGEGL